MRIQNKGVIAYYEDALKAIPNKAVKYIDLELMEKEGQGTASYSIIAMLVPIGIFCSRWIMTNSSPFMFSILGVLIGCVLLLPREILKGMCFVKEGNVELYQMIKPPRIFITCDKPVSKNRFIFMCLLPNLVFGILPLIVWTFISPYTYFARTIFSIGFISTVIGGRDYMYIIKTIGRVPPFSKIQVSGVKMYYY